MNFNPGTAEIPAQVNIAVPLDWPFHNGGSLIYRRILLSKLVQLLGEIGEFQFLEFFLIYQRALFEKVILEPFALSHGLNPFLTSYLNAPFGVNLVVNTSMTLLAIVGWPVTAAIGPVAAFNVLLRLGIALSGLAMYGAVRRWVSWWPAAYVTGAVVPVDGGLGMGH